LGRYPRPTEFLFTTLKAANDTFRMKRLAYPNGGQGALPEIISNYTGVPFGVVSGYLSQATSYIGPSQIVSGDFARPMVLMTNAESQFLLAEAKQRYPAVTLPLTAKDYYEQGRKRSVPSYRYNNCLRCCNGYYIAYKRDRSVRLDSFS
jgi:hypothetical protein